jgi:hypothetical protein
MPTIEQKESEIVKSYGKHIKSTKTYDNGVIMIKFSNNDKVMWLKRMITENHDLSVKTSTRGGKYSGIVYWFE